MNQVYFDAVVLGDSLAGQIAAALLVRSGCRLLTLRPENSAPPTAWCFSSLLLERILDQLDGRAVLTKPQRFQYLGTGVRLDIHGRHPFAEEARREFPGDFEAVLAATTDLAELGEKLTELLWSGGGLPLAGLGVRFGLRLRGLRRGLSSGRLGETLADRLEELEAPTAAAFIGGLLSALALCSSDRMTLAEGALLWHGAMRPAAASRAGLDELLRRRYQQFHGEEDELARLESLTVGQRQPSRLQLKGGRQIAAGCLLVADPAAAACLPEALRPASAGTARQPDPIRLGAMVPPVLADQVLLDGSPPLRLSFSGPEGQRRVMVECAGEIAPAELGTRLQALCPFASPDGELNAALSLPSPEPGLAAARRRIAPAPGLYFCSAAALPPLGSIGEALTGLSVATALRRRLKKSD